MYIVTRGVAYVQPSPLNKVGERERGAAHRLPEAWDEKKRLIADYQNCLFFFPYKWLFRKVL